ncbi:MAG: hypothetical protein NTW08_02420 [Gammaproteobacteria bacterium]|nr:hypothetical protein [Gammaproteobacteria bacterium]
MDAYTQDKQQTPASHKKAAEHHENAAKFHVEAARHHEAGNHEKGNAAAHIAHGHALQAVEHASNACKNSAGKSCKE